MDTTMRITTVCDGDKRLISPMLAEVAERVTVDRLQSEYEAILWYEEGMKAVIAYRDMFTPTLEEMAKAFMKFAEAINSMFIKIIRERLKQQKWYNLTSCNNYRKLHALPLMRRLRCRWRQRESRKAMEGMSSGVVYIDEYAFEVVAS